MMHHPRRTSTALRQLADLGQAPAPSRWAWSIAKLDVNGRITLPPPARRALALRTGATATVRGRCRRVTLVLRRAGAGAPITADARGRLAVPAWLRQAAAGSGSFLLGARDEPPLVIVAPASVLDDVGDRLAGDDPAGTGPHGPTSLAPAGLADLGDRGGLGAEAPR